MYGEPRNWKWMVPAALISPCIAWWSNALNLWKWGNWAMIPLGLAIIFGIATLVNGWAYVAEKVANMNANTRTVQNSTPEVRMFEAAKGMHPDAVKALLVHRRTIWEIKYIPLKDSTDWVYQEMPSVHAGFVDFVLDNSNGTLMSKRLLAEGSKKFDPDGVISDYEQYDALLLFMHSKLMVTQAYGNQGPKLIPPWTVDLLRHRFGLTGDVYQVDDGISEAMRKVMNSQQVAVSDQRGLDTPMSAKNASATRPASDVIAKALEDLEQTQMMKARNAQLFGK